MSRGAFVVPIGGFGLVAARQRIEKVLADFVPYSRLQLRRRPRAVTLTLGGRNQSAVARLGDSSRWTIINGSYRRFTLNTGPSRAMGEYSAATVLPALVVLGLVAQADATAVGEWLRETERDRERFRCFKGLRAEAERLGYKVIRGSSDEARRRRNGGQ
jgi:hypothetical protein